MQADDKKKSAVLDLTKHVDQKVRVKFTGGREGEANHLVQYTLASIYSCYPRRQMAGAQEYFFVTMAADDRHAAIKICSHDD